MRERGAVPLSPHSHSIELTREYYYHLTRRSIRKNHAIVKNYFGKFDWIVCHSSISMASVGGSIADIVRYGLDDNYYDTFPGKVAALHLNEVSTAAKKVIRPDNLTWVVVGDRAKIEAGVRELGFGEVKLINTEGEAAK